MLICKRADMWPQLTHLARHRRRDDMENLKLTMTHSHPM